MPRLSSPWSKKKTIPRMVNITPKNVSPIPISAPAQPSPAASVSCCKPVQVAHADTIGAHVGYALVLSSIMVAATAPAAAH